jgi:hypothetical protein
LNAFDALDEQNNRRMAGDAIKKLEYKKREMAVLG